MEKYYTSERNIQILIALMKEYGIRKIVLSPGSSNISFSASVQINDTYKLSVELPTVHDKTDEWSCDLIANKALSELKRGTGGPVHINMITICSLDFSVIKLPEVNVIKRVCRDEQFPNLTGKRIAVFVGQHGQWSEGLTKAVERFCENYNALVLCDRTAITAENTV